MAVAFCGAISPAAADCDLMPDETVRVAAVIDGDTLRLADGRQVRLAGLLAPKPSPPLLNFATRSLAADAQARLSNMVLTGPVRLSYGGSREDRYGRILAHLHLDDGSWVQGRMVAAGYARVSSFADNRACIRPLLAYEGDARSDGRGLWALDVFAPLVASDPDSLLGLAGTFQLVEGRVHDVSVVRGRVYLNFAEDWKTDFTVTIAPRDRKHFAADLEAYAGAMVRVRGWLGSFNGPEIVATHPEQIEILTGLSPPS